MGIDTIPQWKLDVAGDINIYDPGNAKGFTYRINGLPVNLGNGVLALIIRGNAVNPVTDLPRTGNRVGDAWIAGVDRHIWVWNGSSWFDAGNLLG
jgi:hypothetical protein